MFIINDFIELHVIIITLITDIIYIIKLFVINKIIILFQV